MPTAVQQILRTFSSCKTEALYPLHFPCPLCPWQSPFYFLRVWLFKIPHINGLSKPGAWLISFSIRSLGSSLLLHMTGLPSILRLNHIPRYEYTPFSLSFSSPDGCLVASACCVLFLSFEPCMCLAPCWDGKVTWPGLGPQGCHSAVKGKGKCESRSVVSDSLRPRGLYSPWKSPGQNTGVGSLSLLQGISPTQGSNPGLLHCRQIL